MRVVVGLGNPGSSYARTRHNVGFRVVELLAERHRMRFSERAYRSRIARGTIEGERVLLMQPQTWMNRSGEAVGRARRDLGLDPEDFVLAYDEVDLKLGRIRIRARGSSGGHRGVRSVLEALGSTEVLRVRVGIGRPGGHGDTAEWVLDAPTGDEIEKLEASAVRAAEAVEVLLREGPAAAMNQFNSSREPSGDL